MMDISSSDNAFYKQVKRWAHSVQSQKKQGLCFVDTPHPVHYILNQYPALIDTIIINRSDLQIDLDQLSSLNRPIYRLTSSLFSSLTTPTHQGGILLLVRPQPLIQRIPSSTKSLVICDGLQNAYNFGSIIRSASAFGYDGVMITPNTVYPYHRDAIRASTGYVFSMPLYSMTGDIIDELRSRDFRFFAADVRAKTAIDTISVSPQFAVIFGSEGHGIQHPSFQDLTPHIVSYKIPMLDHVESLNVGIAAGISLFYLQSMVK